MSLSSRACSLQLAAFPCLSAVNLAQGGLYLCALQLGQHYCLLCREEEVKVGIGLMSYSAAWQLTQASVAEKVRNTPTNFSEKYKPCFLRKVWKVYFWSCGIFGICLKAQKALILATMKLPSPSPDSSAA